MTDAPIESVVFPVAGLGTRILPATKAMPKEMLPVVDRPLIEHAVEEARSAGVRKFIFVSAPGRTMIRDHFSRNEELEAVLEKKGRLRELQRVRDCTIDPRRMFFPVQESPLGLGHAVWCAREHVGEGMFAVILPDDLVLSGKSCLQQMVEARAETGGSMIAVENVLPEAVNRYGVIEAGRSFGNLYEVNGIVEKPEPDEAPSSLAVIGRYILSSRIFEFLADQKRGAGDEIQLTDAIRRFLAVEPLHALCFQGRRYDCGHRAGWLAANVAYAAVDKKMRREFRDIVSSLGP